MIGLWPNSAAKTGETTANPIAPQRQGRSERRICFIAPSSGSLQQRLCQSMPLSSHSRGSGSRHRVGGGATAKDLLFQPRRSPTAHRPGIEGVQWGRFKPWAYPILCCFLSSWRSILLDPDGHRFNEPPTHFANDLSRLQLPTSRLFLKMQRQLHADRRIQAPRVSQRHEVISLPPTIKHHRFAR